MSPAHEGGTIPFVWKMEVDIVLRVNIESFVYMPQLLLQNACCLSRTQTRST